MGIVKGLLDCLYPPKCGLCGLIGSEPLCPECLAEMPPGVPRPGPQGPLDWCVSLYQFEGRAAQAVRRLKYGRVTSLALPMARMMAVRLESLSDVDVIVPVPIHKSRLRWRGFNQAALLCEAMPKESVREALVLRVRRTRPQVELAPKERLENLVGAFRADRAVAGKSVLLVDDVVTTGGTGVACARALKEAGALEVGLLTFCGEREHRQPSGESRP